MSINISFPFTIDPFTQQTQCCDEEKRMEDGIRCILLTSVKERYMKPDFGSRVKDYVFEPLHAPTMDLLKKEIYDSITTWSFDVDDVNIDFTTQEESILIHLSYTYQHKQNQLSISLIKDTYG